MSVLSRKRHVSDRSVAGKSSDIVVVSDVILDRRGFKKRIG